MNRREFIGCLTAIVSSLAVPQIGSYADAFSGDDLVRRYESAVYNPQERQQYMEGRVSALRKYAQKNNFPVASPNKIHKMVYMHDDQAVADFNKKPLHQDRKWADMTSVRGRLVGNKFVEDEFVEGELFEVGLESLVLHEPVTIIPVRVEGERLVIETGTKKNKRRSFFIVTAKTFNWIQPYQMDIEGHALLRLKRGYAAKFEERIMQGFTGVIHAYDGSLHFSRFSHDDVDGIQFNSVPEAERDLPEGRDPKLYQQYIRSIIWQALTTFDLNYVTRRFNKEYKEQYFGIPYHGDAPDLHGDYLGSMAKAHEELQDVTGFLKEGALGHSSTPSPTLGKLDNVAKEMDQIIQKANH